MTIHATNGSRLHIGGILPAKSTDFAQADFSGQTALWQEIDEIEGFGSVGDAAAEITFDSVSSGRTRRLKGTRSAGTMEVVCAIDAESEGQTAARLAEETQHDYAFRLVFNDAPAGGTPSERMFVAKVASAVEALDTANNVMKLNLTLWVNSNVVRIAAAGA